MVTREDFRQSRAAEQIRITPMSGAATVPATDRVRIIEERLLSDDWYILKKTTFEYRCGMAGGKTSRETYDRETVPCCCCSMLIVQRWF